MCKIHFHAEVIKSIHNRCHGDLTCVYSTCLERRVIAEVAECVSGSCYILIHYLTFVAI